MPGTFESSSNAEGAADSEKEKRTDTHAFVWESETMGAYTGILKLYNPCKLKKKSIVFELQYEGSCPSYRKRIIVWCQGVSIFNPTTRERNTQNIGVEIVVIVANPVSGKIVNHICSLLQSRFREKNAIEDIFFKQRAML